MSSLVWGPNPCKTKPVSKKVTFGQICPKPKSQTDKETCNQHSLLSRSMSLDMLLLRSFALLCTLLVLLGLEVASPLGPIVHEVVPDFATAGLLETAQEFLLKSASLLQCCHGQLQRLLFQSCNILLNFHSLLFPLCLALLKSGMLTL